MALIISTSSTPPTLSSDEVLYVYNGLDCCVTSQIFSHLSTLIDPQRRLVYNFEMELQVLALEMMERGLAVDRQLISDTCSKLENNTERLRDLINRYASAIWGKGLNPNSHDQMKALFYDYMKLPIQYKIYKQERKPTTERAALEKLVNYFYATAIIRAIMRYEDDISILRVLRKPLDHDGRMRFSINVGATETGRFSSSRHPLGSGTNGQNITDEVRRIFVSDPGYTFVNFDLQSAESYGVAFLSGDEKYLAALRSGDIHTSVAKILWPELPWTSDLSHNIEIAEQKFYRHFTYRYMAKKGGHLSNYDGKPPTMSHQLMLPIQVCREFQHNYFEEFSGIRDWHLEVQIELQTSRKLVTPLGRVRHFFDRPSSHSTIREGIAYLPQSLIVDTSNRGALNIFRKYPFIRLHLQLHDGLLTQFPNSLLHLAPQVAKDFEIETPVRGKIMRIPAEVSIGWNWGKMNKDNPGGLRKIGTDGPKSRELDQLIRSLHGGDRVTTTVP